MIYVQHSVGKLHWPLHNFFCRDISRRKIAIVSSWRHKTLSKHVTFLNMLDIKFLRLFIEFWVFLSLISCFKTCQINCKVDKWLLSLKNVIETSHFLPVFVIVLTFWWCVEFYDKPTFFEEFSLNFPQIRSIWFQSFHKI